MKRSLFISAVIACGILIGNLNAQTVATNPVGFNTVTVTQGTTAALGIPFDRPADFVGLVSSLTSTSITVTGTPWNAGDYGPFTDPTPANTKPHMIRMLSGTNKGRDFKVDNNTNNTLTITTGGNLTTQIAAGDQFQIFPCHSLASAFGTDGAGLVSSNSSSSADQILLRENGAWITYFHTAGVSGFWAQVGGGATNFNNHPILPYSGLLLARRPGSDFSFTGLGAVPTTNLKTDLPNNATTNLAMRFPVDTITLNGLGLQALVGWKSSNSSGSADQVLLRINNAWFTYFHTNTGIWAQIGGGNTDHSTDIIHIGTSVLVARQTGTDVTLDQALPYTLP